MPCGNRIVRRFDAPMTDRAFRTLILETSSRIGIVAVAEGDTILAERRLDERRRHARDLAPTVRDLLHQHGWKPSDVQAVIVDLGPGSYTGLRVGIMAAKAWAYATGCRLVGIPSFAAIAWQSAEALKPLAAPAILWVIGDAQQDRVYCQRFELGDSQSHPAVPRAVSPLQVRPCSEWMEAVAGGAFIAGPAVRLHRAKFPTAAKVVPEAAWDPQPSALLHLGLARLVRGESDPVMAVEPLYARRSSAEELWEKRRGV